MVRAGQADRRHEADNGLPDRYLNRTTGKTIHLAWHRSRAGRTLFQIVLAFGAAHRAFPRIAPRSFAPVQRFHFNAANSSAQPVRYAFAAHDGWFQIVLQKSCH
jgi:hypothetical protein